MPLSHDANYWHAIRNDGVTGSSPVCGTSDFKSLTHLASSELMVDHFEQSQVASIVRGAGIPDGRIETVIEFLIYYGFLGVTLNSETPRYIFDVGYI